MHPIPIRSMNFHVPSADKFHPLYIAGNAALSYSHTATGLYVTFGEPFFVKSLRRIMDKIRDDVLRENVVRFARQEAQHYQRHADFNKVVLAHGYPGLQERLDLLGGEFDDFLADESDRFRIGYIEGFESFTTQLGLQLLSSGLYDHPRTQRAFGDLFKWHMLEEVEHRNVAFDVYQHLYGSYVQRARMCWFAQHHMFKFFSDCTRIMSAEDVKRHGERCRVSPKQRLMFAARNLRMRALTMMPGYTPHRYTVPPAIAELSAHFTQLAQVVR